MRKRAYVEAWADSWICGAARHGRPQEPLLHTLLFGRKVGAGAAHVLRRDVEAERVVAGQQGACPLLAVLAEGARRVEAEGRRFWKRRLKRFDVENFGHHLGAQFGGRPWSSGVVLAAYGLQHNR